MTGVQTCALPIFMHADLPLVEADDIDDFVNRMPTGGLALAGSHDGGTTAVACDAVDRMLSRYPNLDALALTKLDEAPLSLSTFSLLSLRGPGVAFLASTSHLVKGLMEPDSDMLESVIHSSLVGSEAEQLN